MINIRYHIVSITAVFLALGIGIALGSTFLDRATVEVLDRNIRSAETRIRETNAQNDQLQAGVDLARERDTALLLVGGPDLLADQLTDVPTLVITAPGVPAEQVAGIELALVDGGADLRGRLELRDSMILDGDGDEDLAKALAVEGASASMLAAALKAAMADALDAAGAEKQPEVITALIAGDYLNYVPAEGYTRDDPLLAEPGYRYVFVDGGEPKPGQTKVLVDLLPDVESDPLPVVIVSATVEEPTDGEPVLSPLAVAVVRASDPLSAHYSTVDDIETFAGLYAMVVVLRDMEISPAGHYGQGEGATSVLPPNP